MTALDLGVAESAVTVVDLETTGLSTTSGERIVEIAVVRAPIDGEPEVLLDTLIDPGGPVRGTSIHGITDDDVVGAPTFRDVAPRVLALLEGRVLATYNAAFDVAFLRSEYSIAHRGAESLEVPYLCLMWLWPQLGFGRRGTLANACEACGITPGDHSARADAIAAARLWQRYAQRARESGAVTFRDLRGGRKGVFWESLERPPLTRDRWSMPGSTRGTPALKPRDGGMLPVPVADIPDRAGARRAYWHALLDILEDTRVTEDEIAFLRRERQRLGLSSGELRAVHAKYFGNRLEALSADEHISDAEHEELQVIYSALLELGWAPGTL